MNLFLLIIGTIAIVFGVKFTFDARPIAKKYFSLDDKNEATVVLKILGFAVSVIGTILIIITL